MVREKSYAPVASYEQLKQTEPAINRAATADYIREVTKRHGANVGYKAFCCLLTGKVAPEGMNQLRRRLRPFLWKKQAIQMKCKKSTAAFRPSILTIRWLKISGKVKMEFHNYDDPLP